MENIFKYKMQHKIDVCSQLYLVIMDTYTKSAE